MAQWVRKGMVVAAAVLLALVPVACSRGGGATSAGGTGEQAAGTRRW